MELSRCLILSTFRSSSFLFFCVVADKEADSSKEAASDASPTHEEGQAGEAKDKSDAQDTDGSVSTEMFSFDAASYASGIYTLHRNKEIIT